MYIITYENRKYHFYSLCECETEPGLDWTHKRLNSSCTCMVCRQFIQMMYMNYFLVLVYVPAILWYWNNRHVWLFINNCVINVLYSVNTSWNFNLSQNLCPCAVFSCQKWRGVLYWCRLIVIFINLDEQILETIFFFLQFCLFDMILLAFS